MYKNAVEYTETRKQTRNYTPKIALQCGNDLSQPEFPWHSHLQESVGTGSILRSMCATGAVGMLPIQSLHGDQLVIIPTVRESAARERQSKCKGMLQDPERRDLA